MQCARAAQRVTLFGLALVLALGAVNGAGAAPAGLLVAMGAATPMDSSYVTQAGVTAPDTLGEAAESSALPPQRDIMDVARSIFGKRVEPQLEGSIRKGIIWTILPTVSYNPVYGLAVGASVSGAGRLGDRPGSKPSVISMSANYSTTGQFQAQFRGDVFTASGDYLLKPDVRYIDTSRSTWGLGPVTPEQQEYPMDFKMTRFYFTGYRRTSGPVYFGLGYHLDIYNEIVDQRAVAGETTPFTVYSRGAPSRTEAAGFSLNLLGDTRDNIVNATRGYYLSATIRDYLTEFGSDDNWQELWAEARLYPRIPHSSRNTLGFWIYNWFTFGDPPYLGLPSIGWDTYGRGGRGYLQGRIRGRNQIYVESEYRLRITRDGLIGAVGFFGVTMTSVENGGTFGKPDRSGGIGLRLKFNKHSDTNLTLDYGWGESGSGGFFMGMTEVF